MQVLIDINIKDARCGLYATDQNEKWLLATDEEIKDEIIRRWHAVEEVKEQNENYRI